MKNITIQLEELACPMCAGKITSALQKVPGILSATVSTNTSKAKVSFDENQTSRESVLETITNLGYEIISCK